MARFSKKDISLRIEFDISSINVFEVIQSVNRHFILKCEGILESESGKRASIQPVSNNINVFIDHQLVLSARTQKFAVSQENEIYRFSLTAFSTSSILDISPRNFFYQNTKQSWADVVRKSVKKDGGYAIATKGKEHIKVPMLQYLETPWEYIRRIAAKIGTVITPDALSDNPSICLGLPKGQVYTVDSTQIIMHNDILTAKRNRILRRNKEVITGVSYHIEDERIFHLGDILDIGAIRLPIVSILRIMKGDILENHYTIAEEEAVFEEPWENKKQAGLSLTGSVLNTSGDELTVLLDIPDDGEERASWFEYAPVTNNGMYAMPPKDTPVALQWQSAKDGDIKVIHTVRDGAKLTESYEYRSMITEYNQQMHMGPTEVAFFSDGNRFVLNKGIRIGTNAKLRLQADKNITISAKRKLHIKSPEEVFITKPGFVSNVWMKAREIHVKSSTTTIHSSGKGTLLPLPYREPLKQVTMKASTLATLVGSVPQRVAVKK